MKKKKSYPLSDLSKEQLSVMASDIRSTIMTTVLKNGGHLSPNLGAVEMTMSLLCHFDPLEDDILFDVGHQTYAYKILTGRDLSDLRQYNGEEPFSNRFSSPYDKYNNGHAGTSLSVAYGIAKAKLLNGDPSRTVCVIGDSSIVSGLAFESLNSMSDDHKTPLIIVLNDNDMSISKHVGHIQGHIQKLRNSRFYFRTSSSFGRMMSKHKKSYKLFLKMRSWKDHFRNLLLTPTMFESMGMKYIGPIDGHDFSALDLGIEKALVSSKHGPVILHVVTKKGYGYKEAMMDQEGIYHGVDPDFDSDTIDRNILSFTKMKTDFLSKKMEEDKKTVLISPAMEQGSNLNQIFEKYPERSFDVGIAEEEAITFASGFALKGYHPVVDIYSTFLQRSYDEIMEDVSRERIPLLMFIERAGITGHDGESHQGIYDVAMLKSIPYSRSYMPFSKASFDYLMNHLDFSLKGPLAIRIPKDSPIVDVSSPTDIHAQYIKKEGNETLIIATGPKGYQLSIEQKNVDILMLFDLLIEKNTFLSYVSDYKNILFVDPYSVKEASDRLLESYLSGTDIHYESLSIPMDFVTHGDIETLYQKLGFTKERVEEILSLLRTKKEQNDNNR